MGHFQKNVFFTYCLHVDQKKVDKDCPFRQANKNRQGLDVIVVQPI